MSQAKKVVGNCPRCGMPIYETKGRAAKSCQCFPLSDAAAWYPYQPPRVAPYNPYPYNPCPYNPWYPWQMIPYTTGGTVIVAGGEDSTTAYLSGNVTPT